MGIGRDATPVFLGVLVTAGGFAVCWLAALILGVRPARPGWRAAVGAIAGGLAVHSLTRYAARHEGDVEGVALGVYVGFGLAGGLALLFAWCARVHYRVCREMVRRIGGTELGTRAPTLWPRQSMSFEVAGVRGRIEVVSSGDESGTSVARLVYPLAEPVPFRCWAFAQGRGLQRVLRRRFLDPRGLRRIETGVAHFDAAVLVESNDEAAARALLTEEVQAALLAFIAGSEPRKSGVQIERSTLALQREMVLSAEALVAFHQACVPAREAIVKALGALPH